MSQISNWDWDSGKRVITDIQQWRGAFGWVEEPCASPDGESVAAIVKVDGEAFAVCENGVPWENSFDKIWFLRYLPDGRAAAFVSDTAEWTVAIDGKTWQNWFEFIWDGKFNCPGGNVSAAAQKEMSYFAVTNDIPWQQGFYNLSHLRASPAGDAAAAVVQTKAINEADIASFRKGCFTVAVDGSAWPRNFLNVWELSFDSSGQRVAAEVRMSVNDYTIAVNAVPWNRHFSSVWQPAFNPADGSVTAPVRVSGGWSLARDGELIWGGRYFQLWHHIYSQDGIRIAAIVSPKFGRWTLAVDDVAWKLTFSDLATDPVLSPDGRCSACVGKTDGKWTIAVDGRAWDEAYDMAWPPVFSPDSRHVAAKTEKNGVYRIVVNGHPATEEYKTLWNPLFSPDGKKLLVRGIVRDNDKDKYVRTVLSLADILG